MKYKNHIEPDFNIESLQNGDERAFEAVFSNYYKALCYFSGRMVKNTQAAEDIATETFMKLWNKREVFQSTSHIRSFLYKTAYYASLDFLKMGDRAKKREVTFSDSLPESENFYLEMIRTETLHTLYQAIRGLPEQCGRIIHMSYLDGRRNEEIAGELNISVQTVKNQKSKGVKILRRQFPDAATGLSILLILQELLH